MVLRAAQLAGLDGKQQQGSAADLAGRAPKQDQQSAAAHPDAVCDSVSWRLDPQGQRGRGRGRGRGREGRQTRTTALAGSACRAEWRRRGFPFGVMVSGACAAPDRASALIWPECLRADALCLSLFLSVCLSVCLSLSLSLFVFVFGVFVSRCSLCGWIGRQHTRAWRPAFMSTGASALAMARLCGVTAPSLAGGALCAQRQARRLLEVSSPALISPFLRSCRRAWHGGMEGKVRRRWRWW